MRKSLSVAVVSSSFAALALLTFAQNKPNSDNDKPRVFITDSQSWDMAAYGGGGGGGGGSIARGGARPQTAEIVKTFGQRCPQVVTNNIQAKSDYVVVLDHEGGKGFVRHKNKVAVFARASGDSIASKSTVSLGGSVQDACEAITKDWAEHGASMRAEASGATPATTNAPATAPSAAAQSAAPPPIATPVAVKDPPAAAQSAQAPAAVKISVVSSPDGADIEVDSGFVGSTPSDVQVPEGDHVITVKKSGYKDWERKMRVSAGSNVHLSAELEKSAQ